MSVDDARGPSRRHFLAVTGAILVAGCRRDDDELPPIASATEAIEDSAAGAPTAPAIPLVESEPTIRVRVHRFSAGRGQATIGVNGQWVALHRVVADTPDEPAVAVVLHGPVRVTRTRAGWSVLDDRGFRPHVRADDQLEFTPGEPGDDGRLAFNDATYPGRLRCVAGKDQAWDVVNYVLLETYLPAVLAGELYHHWREETFAAQAIAARSYACSEHSYRSRRSYDLTDTAHSQVYDTSAETERARAAVAATRGRVLAHDNRLVPGYYSSCCGGLAASAVDAIGSSPINQVPPLRGRVGEDTCTGAQLYSWSIERPTPEVVRRMERFGRRRKLDAMAKLRRLDSIDVAERNPHGRPLVYEVKGEGGTTPLDAESLRRALDQSGGGLTRPRRPLWSSFLETITVGRRTTRFDGRGHGHGVGLCQHGAEALARDGMRAREILAWYYPEVAIVPGYPSPATPSSSTAG